ncbi:MAG: P-II family nitrogen regulator [Nitrospirae bacterium]|nr:P-II family nitrogen regulator [Nitrospirota bacterium]
MKKIDAIIRPFELDSVKEALVCLGIQGMTVTEVKVPRDWERPARIFDHSTEFMPKLKIEIIVFDSIAVKVMETINKSINKNSDNNDNIFISHIEDVVRIRTAQKGEDAIS